MATVFIVDDDMFIHTVLTRLFAIRGHRVIESAYDGQDAIEKFQEMTEKPDVILMDHRMPIMKGLDATQRLLELDPSLRILFVSADETVREAAMEVGAIAFLTKPVDGKTLFDFVERSAMSTIPMM